MKTGGRSHCLVLAAFMCASTPAIHAAEVVASGITIPFFDAAGKLTHRMTASHGTKAGTSQQLQDVELVYFSEREPNVIVQKVLATDATWDDKKELLTGRGKIVVATEENRITGEGFDFALGTGLLHIQRDFKMDNAELLVSSTRATVELMVERAGEDVKVRDVKRCEAIGNLEIVVQPTAKKHYDFVRAYSERAIYFGATRIIEVPQQIRYVKPDGHEATSNTLTIKLARPAAKKK
jgi:hypothetical protein